MRLTFLCTSSLDYPSPRGRWLPLARELAAHGHDVRMALLHHSSWSVNSICHMIGDRPFRSRDRSANFWPLAILSMGESWHNSHHADPTCARHGVRRAQIDISARLIWAFEKLGWVWQVRWPTPQRLARLAKPATT